MDTLLTPRFAPSALSSKGTDCFSEDLQNIFVIIYFKKSYRYIWAVAFEQSHPPSTNRTLTPPHHTSNAPSQNHWFVVAILSFGNRYFREDLGLLAMVIFICAIAGLFDGIWRFFVQDEWSRSRGRWHINYWRLKWTRKILLMNILFVCGRWMISFTWQLLKCIGNLWTWLGTSEMINDSTKVKLE